VTKRRLLQALTTPILLLPAALVVALMVVIPLAVLAWYSFAPDGPERRFLSTATVAWSQARFTDGWP
jgi:ABC-type sugar transport system permease subunit